MRASPNLQTEHCQLRLTSELPGSQKGETRCKSYCCFHRMKAAPSSSERQSFRLEPQHKIITIHEGTLWRGGVKCDVLTSRGMSYTFPPYTRLLPHQDFGFCVWCSPSNLICRRSP